MSVQIARKPLRKRESFKSIMFRRQLQPKPWWPGRPGKIDYIVRRALYDRFIKVRDLVGYLSLASLGSGE